MRSHLIRTLLAAAALALLSLPSGATQIDEQASFSSDAPANVQADVDKAGKPTIVIIRDRNNCEGSCGNMMQQYIYAEADHPEVRFISGTPEEWGIPKELLPFVIVVSPHCGVIRRLPNYVPQSEEAIAYLVAHINDGAAMEPVTRTCK